MSSSASAVTDNDNDGCLLEVKNLSRAFGSTVAVDKASFRMGRGEIVGLLGPNGSGKSTLLRMLSGTLRPSNGTVLIDGTDLKQNPVATKLKLGYVPDEAQLYPQMRVTEFLSLMARLRFVQNSQLAERVAIVSKRFALGPVLRQRIGSLSRGYRQRVAIAQAVIHEPIIVLMDEPSNGLDPRQHKQWRAIVRELANHCGVLFTTHVLHDVDDLADRVLMLVEGKLRAIALSSNRTFEFAVSVQGDVQHAASTLAHLVELLEYVQHTPINGYFHVKLNDGVEISEVIRVLVEASINISSVHPVRVDLERAYVEAASSDQGIEQR